MTAYVQPQLRILAAHFARVLFKVPPSSYRGSRECRTLDASAASRVEKNTRVSHHGHAGTPGTPRAMVLTVSFALSRVTGLGCHPRRRNRFHQLDASVGASGPHDFAVRKPGAFVNALLASTASCPASVTISSRPSVGQDGERYAGDLRQKETEIFLQRGLDMQITKQLVGQIAS